MVWAICHSIACSVPSLTENVYWLPVNLSWRQDPTWVSGKAGGCIHPLTRTHLVSEKCTYVWMKNGREARKIQIRMGLRIILYLFHAVDIFLKWPTTQVVRVFPNSFVEKVNFLKIKVYVLTRSVNTLSLNSLPWIQTIINRISYSLSLWLGYC